MEVAYIKNGDKQHNEAGNKTQKAWTTVSWTTD